MIFDEVYKAKNRVRARTMNPGLVVSFGPNTWTDAVAEFEGIRGPSMPKMPDPPEPGTMLWGMPVRLMAGGREGFVVLEA